MFEDYVPYRLEFTLATKAKGVSKASPANVTVDGRYLYGAPAAELDLEGEVVVSPAKEGPGFAGHQFGLANESVEIARQPLEAMPEPESTGYATITDAPHT